ncbi:MAG TPA: alpha-ketoglutarate-dependent dioxygenase AlkB [Candidatus Nanopelagicales bacterium]|nr:alpha-ketoglutarate-dependent dioxygenase AlkB [Candidatus Nanopelagicales bacterium]
MSAVSAQRTGWPEPPSVSRTRVSSHRSTAPTVALQGSLLDLSDDVRLGALSGRVERTVLAHGAWVDHRPGWVQGSDAVLDVLLHDVPWVAERRRMYDRVVDVPRLISWYDGDAPLPHPLLADARAALSAYYRPELGEPFVTAGMCLYRDGRDSVAWHGDTIGRSATEDTLVAIVSFGSPRTLALRPRGGGPSQHFSLGHGDLVVMGGSCQRTWEHAVPKTAGAVGPRVSVQFRPAGVA